MKNKTKMIILVALLLPAYSIAHGGGTDRQGGHHDRQNGTYHYHHGEGPHQHIAGVCTLSDDYNYKSNPKKPDKQGDRNWWPVMAVLAALGVGYSLGESRRR